MLNINEFFFRVKLLSLLCSVKKGAGGMLIVVNTLQGNTLLGHKNRSADVPGQGQKARQYLIYPILKIDADSLFYHTIRI